MVRLDEHPTVVATRGRVPLPMDDGLLDTEWLRQICLEAGADDVGFVEIDRPEISGEKPHVTAVFPQTKTLVSIVCRMNREPVRRVQRSVANAEFHETGHEVNEVARELVQVLERRGIRAVNPPMAFPMEAANWPERMWVVSHKPVAVAAGMGMMGIHRNVIHPRFGNFILLGTVLLEARLTEYSRPINYNPCLECKLCVAVCPVGAIGSDGHFDLASCYTHNYREFMGGFTDWVGQVAESKNRADLGRRVTQPEQISMWQSLAFGPNYKSGYCIAVCPAGEEVIGPFLKDRAGFLEEVVKPIQKNTETVYVVPQSDAEDHVRRRFPHKKAQLVRGSLIPTTIPAFLFGIRVGFQREQAKGLDAVYHFTFTGKEPGEATVTIRDKTIQVENGRVGKANCEITADSETWLGFLRKERNILWALFRRRIRVKGGLKWLIAFGKCFPS